MNNLLPSQDVMDLLKKKYPNDPIAAADYWMQEVDRAERSRRRRFLLICGAVVVTALALLSLCSY